MFTLGLNVVLSNFMGNRLWWNDNNQQFSLESCKFIHSSYQTVLARTSALRSAGGDDDLMRWFLCWVFRWKKLNVVPWKSRARKCRTGKLKSCRKISFMPECWSRVGVTADLDAPRIWTPPQSKFVSGYGSHFANLDPPYRTFLLSILCIIFGN